MFFKAIKKAWETNKTSFITSITYSDNNRIKKVSFKFVNHWSFLAVFLNAKEKLKLAAISKRMRVKIILDTGIKE